MQERVVIQVIRKGELRSAGPAAASDSFAVLSPQKRRALLENPLSDSDDDAVQFLGVRGGRAAGRLDAIVGRFDVCEAGMRAAPSTAVPCLWASYLYVPPEHRNTLLGVTLVLKLQQSHANVAVCGVAQVVLPLYQKLRWRDFEMPGYILLRRSRSVVERYVGNRFLRRRGRFWRTRRWPCIAGSARPARAFRKDGLRVEPVEAARPPKWTRCWAGAAAWDGGQSSFRAVHQLAAGEQLRDRLAESQGLVLRPDARRAVGRVLPGESAVL